MTPDRHPVWRPPQHGRARTGLLAGAAAVMMAAWPGAQAARSAEATQQDQGAERPAMPPPRTGDAARGAALVASRSQGLCVLCHALPGQAAAHQGTLGPPLDGVGRRLDADALRQRLLAPERFNPDTVMPAYGRTDGLLQVPTALRGKPLLSPTQVDDVVAYLASLQ